MQHTALRRSVLADAHAGSELAFEHLIGALVEPGYRLACGMLRDPEAARDAVQEACIKAWRKLGQVRDEGKVRPWFLSIVANECRNTRRLVWSARVTTGLPETGAASTEEAIVRGTDLRNALGRLGHEDRTIVVLFFYLDLPLEEVAEAVGMSVSATKARLYRSVRRMRPDLDPEEAIR